MYRAPSGRTLVVIAAGALLSSAILFLARPAVVTVDGHRVESDVAPVTTANSERAYVPLRSVADALGAETIDRKNGRIDVVRGGESLRLHVGDRHATLNGMPLTLARAPFRVRGRVMIGINAVARAFGVRVVYNPRTARIDVLTQGIGEATTPGVLNDRTQ